MLRIVFFVMEIWRRLVG